MIRRTTLSADSADLAVLENEARQRRVSLNKVLQEIVRQAVEERRARRPQPSFGIFRGPGRNVAREIVEDEDAPARGRLRS